MSRLAGKTALVTAAAQGIGRATAELFIREGARVIASDIDLDKLSTLEQLRAPPARRARSARDSPRSRASSEPSTCSSTAWATSTRATFSTATRTAWRDSIDLNMTPMYRTIRAFLPAMLANGGGSIVNVASVAAVKGVPGRFAYMATKAAIVGITKSTALDFVARGIRCNAICPGTVDTPSLHERMAATGDYQAARAAFIARQPMGRLGTPEEVAALALYLASDESGFMTGQLHLLDGGWTT